MSRTYELVQVSTAEQWQAVHDLRQAELFVRHPGIVYDPAHPDDRAPMHFLFLLQLDGRAMGTARLDLDEPGRAILRLVAIAKTDQRKGHGWVLQRRVEDFARSRNVIDLFVNAAPSAVGFYERMGFIREDWDDPNGARKGVADDCVPMRKRL